MSFPKYPEYKKSGVIALEEIPSNWNLVQLRRIEPVIESGTSVNAIDNEPPPGKPAVLKTSCVYTRIFRAEECKEILEDEIGRATCPVKQDSLIVSRMNTPELVGAAGLVESDSETLFLPDRLWQVRFRKATSAFIYNWTQSNLYRDQVKAVCSGTSSSMQNLSQDDFLSFYLPLPNRQEQLAIASFLDHETAKIDALISEQQRLIELLQEKRQAVISHAVTKGLNPNAPMKDSGVEWLGEVPEHWGVKKASWLFETSKGRNAQDLTQEYCAENSGEFPVFSGQTKNDGVMGYVDSFEFDVGEEGVILTTTVGAKAMSIRLITNKFSLSQNCMIISPRCKEVLARYYAFGFQPSFLYERSLIPDHMQPSFRMEDFSQLWIQVPPMEEQQKICKHIEEQEEGSLSLEREVVRAISLLQERRSALISAAVTGQIDVRGLVPEEESA